MKTGEVNQTTPELLAIAREVGARVSAEHRHADNPLISMSCTELEKFVSRVTAAPQEGVSPWKLPEPLLKFDDWLNAPPSREVPEHEEAHAYRFQAYHRWEAAIKELRALGKSAAPQPPASALPLAVGVEPYAYAIYLPDQPTELLVHDLEEAIDDLTNREHEIKPLYTAPPPLSPPDTGNVGATAETAREVADRYAAAKMPPHEPTIAVGELLDDFVGEDREWAWDAITAYADIHARAYLDSAAALPPPGRTEWKVQIMQDWEPRRLRLTIGVQSFDLDIHDDPEEPGRMEWHCAQLTKAMEKLSPPGRGMVPMTTAEIDLAVRNAQIAFAIDKFKTFEEALVRKAEAHHGIKEGS